MGGAVLGRHRPISLAAQQTEHLFDSTSWVTHGHNRTPVRLGIILPAARMTRLGRIPGVWMLCGNPVDNYTLVIRTAG
jgi:hypothetical protein